MKMLPMILLSLLPCMLCAQDSTHHKKIVKRWPIWYTPSKANVINGITLSPIESFYFYEDRSQQFNGITLHAIGIMLFPLLPGDPNDLFVQSHPGLTLEELLTAMQKEDTGHATEKPVINGLLLSVTGTMTETCNGISISPWCGMNTSVNGFVLNMFLNLNNHLKGLGLALLFNSSFDVKGVQIGGANSAYKLEGMQLGIVNKNKPRAGIKGIQIGIFNKTGDLEGIQIGLFNKNKYRSLPIVNWHFSSKKDKKKERHSN